MVQSLPYHVWRNCALLKTITKSMSRTFILIFCAQAPTNRLYSAGTTPRFADPTGPVSFSRPGGFGRTLPAVLWRGGASGKGCFSPSPLVFLGEGGESPCSLLIRGSDRIANRTNGAIGRDRTYARKLPSRLKRHEVQTGAPTGGLSWRSFLCRHAHSRSLLDQRRVLLPPFGLDFFFWRCRTRF